MAQAAAETEWYLDILLEDLHAWDDALAYLQDLARQQAAAALKKHGKVCSWEVAVPGCDVLCCAALRCAVLCCAVLCVAALWH